MTAVAELKAALVEYRRTHVDVVCGLPVDPREIRMPMEKWKALLRELSAMHRESEVGDPFANMGAPIVVGGDRLELVP